jgi:RNA polymerase sigma-70 factor, ECF subfamily
VELDDGVNPPETPIEPSKDPYGLYVDNIEREYLRAAIQQLPVDLREIILLREYDESSYQEIAALLDCPLGTVMSRLGRARAKLRSLLSAVFQPIAMAENTPNEPSA